MDWTLEVLYNHFDYYIPGITASLLESLDEENYRQLLLAKADELFREGRYNVNSECALEMYMEPEAEESLHDLKQIALLTDEERTKLHFFQQLKEFCYPLFRRKSIDLSSEPFCMSDSRFSIMNRELRNFIYDSPYSYLSAVLCDVLIEELRKSEPLIESVLCTSLSEKFFYTVDHNRKNKNKFCESLNDIADAIWKTANHLELGKRMGMSPLAQAIYDDTDTFICETYDYRQVDYAKEMEAWIAQNWNCPQDGRPEKEMVDKLIAALEQCAERHEVTFIDKQGTLMFLLGDTLGVSLFNDDYDEDDEDWDLPDD